MTRAHQIAAPAIALGIAGALAGCSTSAPNTPQLTRTYTASIRVDAVSVRTAATVWTAPESIDVRITVIDSTVSPPAAIAVGDVRVTVGTSPTSTRLPRLADRTTYAGRARMPPVGETVRLAAEGAAGRVDSFTVVFEMPELPHITKPDPDSSLFPTRENLVQWSSARTADSIEVVLRSIDSPADSFVTRPGLDDGFTRLGPDDVSQIPQGPALLRVTRIRRVTFSGGGLVGGSATAAASGTESVYILAPETPHAARRPRGRAR
jgi:hypothetical protein